MAELVDTSWIKKSLDKVSKKIISDMYLLDVYIGTNGTHNVLVKKKSLIVMGLDNKAYFISGLALSHLLLSRLITIETSLLYGSNGIRYYKISKEGYKLIGELPEND